MASADFCVFSTALRLWLRLSAHSAQTSPGTTRFFSSIYLPHLPHAIPCSYWASTCWAALPSHIAFYAVSVRQARGLPVVSLFPHPASFRFRLTTDTLAFGFLLPATGRIRVFHPLETCAAGRTQKDCPLRADSLSSIRRQFPISNGTPPSESSHTSAHSPETRSSSGAARAARDSAPSTRSTQVCSAPATSG
jgi:hypothetical protein